VRIGILGAAGIAPRSVMAPAARRNDTSIVAVAARSQDRADSYARQHGIAKAYADYRALLNDPDIDLVYVALPPSEHARWSIAALEAGKDVLCEKPIAFDRSEAQDMADVAHRTGRRLIEAFHDRYHPLGVYLSELRHDSRLGEILTVEASFNAPNPFNPQSIRHAPELGGGALMDLGCYPVHWVRTIVGEEPDVDYASAVGNPLGADLSFSAGLRFPSGATAVVSSSMAPDTTFSSSITVTAENGTVTIDNPVLTHRGHTVRTHLDTPRTRTFGGQETFDHQLEAVIGALTHETPLPTEAPDFVANMAAIDAIYLQAGLRRQQSPSAGHALAR
jgi:predicted dehydrogenase